MSFGKHLSGLVLVLLWTSHARFDWSLTQRSRVCVPVLQTNGAYPKTCPTAIRRLPFHTNTWRVGVCANLKQLSTP